MSIVHPTPRQAYDKARADVQQMHRYTTEGIHAVCSCGEVGTITSIGGHIEKLAEAAGRAAKDKEVARRAAEYEAAEVARKKQEAAEIAARLARLQIAEEDAAKR